MQSMVTTPLAIFLHLDAIGIVLLVLLRRVVTTFAFGACQYDLLAHEYSLGYCRLPFAFKAHEPS